MSGRYDANLAAECPWIIRICTDCDVLPADEEYRLIKLARPSIKAGKILNNKKYKARIEANPKVKYRLIRAVAKGQKAQKKLVEHNYRLIISIGKKLQNRGLTWEDMIQHGSEGLLYAVERFDTETGNKLSTYASQWIRQRIGRAIENTGRLIRIPIHMQARINEIKYIYRKKMEEDQVLPTSEEIAQIYNLNLRNKKNFKPITKDQAEELGRYIQDIQSLDKTAGGDDDAIAPMHYVKDTTEGPEGITEVSMNQQYLASLLDQLDDDDAAFLKFLYGLVDGTQKSHAKAAEMFQIGIKEARDRESSLLAKLEPLANSNKVNLDLSGEKWSVVLLTTENLEQVEVLMGRTFESPVPLIVHSSADKDQMLLLAKRVSMVGGRAVVIHNI